MCFRLSLVLFAIIQHGTCSYTFRMPGALSIQVETIPFVGRRNEYQPKGSEALHCRVKADIFFVRVWQVKLCDPLVTQESYLSALRWCIMIKRYINSGYFTYLLTRTKQTTVFRKICSEFVIRLITHKTLICRYFIIKKQAVD